MPQLETQQLKKKKYKKKKAKPTTTTKYLQNAQICHYKKFSRQYTTKLVGLQKSTRKTK